MWLAEDDLRPKVKAVSLEYFLDERFAGQGLMTEALEALLPYAFFKLGAVVVSARVFVENRASQRVLENWGLPGKAGCGKRCGATGMWSGTTCPSPCCGRSLCGSVKRENVRGMEYGRPGGSQTDRRVFRPL